MYTSGPSTMRLLASPPILAPRDHPEGWGHVSTLQLAVVLVSLDVGLSSEACPELPMFISAHRILLWSPVPLTLLSLTLPVSSRPLFPASHIQRALLGLPTLNPISLSLLSPSQTETSFLISLLATFSSGDPWTNPLSSTFKIAPESNRFTPQHGHHPGPANTTSHLQCPPHWAPSCHPCSQ